MLLLSIFINPNIKVVQASLFLFTLKKKKRSFPGDPLGETLVGDFIYFIQF